jgi:osmoprotectant transport system ATP-binding protein
LLIWKGAGVRYGDRPALIGLDLEVGPGQLLALVGSSGSGKTTALRTVNRLVEVTEGDVLVGGRSVGAIDGPTLRRGIGTVLQGVGLLPHRTVAWNVGTVPRLLGWTADAIAARVAELLELVGLGGFGERLPRQLSGGQAQRVGLARALAARPPILLLDEPFGALDPLVRDDLQRELRALHDRLGLTTVLVTHDMTEALLLADRIAVLRDGRLLRAGTPREVLADPGDPWVARLLDSPRRQVERLETLR